MAAARSAGVLIDELLKFVGWCTRAGSLVGPRANGTVWAFTLNIIFICDDIIKKSSIYLGPV